MTASVRRRRWAWVLSLGALFGGDACAPTGPTASSDFGAARLEVRFAQAPVVTIGNRLLFSSELDGLYSTDGTVLGTVLIAPRLWPVHTMTKRGGTAYIGRDDTLWKSDGTAAGTEIVARLPPPSTQCDRLDGLTTAGHLMFFVVTPCFTDRDPHVYLWRSDGTDAGTRMVRDIRPGPEDSVPSGLMDGNGRLYFAGFDPEHGVEPWTSDGTASGTFMIRDLIRGAVSSRPRWLGAVGHSALLSAHNGDPYREDRDMWIVEAPASPSP